MLVECLLWCECRGVSADDARDGTADPAVRRWRFDWQRKPRFHTVADFLLLFCGRALCIGLRIPVHGTPLSCREKSLVSTNRRLRLPNPSNWFKLINSLIHLLFSIIFCSFTNWRSHWLFENLELPLQTRHQSMGMKRVSVWKLELQICSLKIQ